MADYKHAKYMTKDGKTQLFQKDGIEDALKDGWKIADGEKSNGEPWNPETRDDEVSITDAQAEVQRSNQVRQDKIDEEEEAEREKARKEAEKASEEVPERADMKVEVIEPKKSSKK